MLMEECRINRKRTELMGYVLTHMPKILLILENIQKSRKLLKIAKDLANEDTDNNVNNNNNLVISFIIMQ